MLQPLAILALLVGSTPAETTSVSGRVTLNGLRPSGQAVWVTRSDECPAVIQDRRVEAQEEGWLKDVVVSLVRPANRPPDEERRRQDVRLETSHCGLGPTVQIAQVGAFVSVGWGRGSEHRLRAYRDGRRVWSAHLERTPLLVLDEPGVVDVRCEAGHEWEVSWIYVTGERFATVTDEAGRFAIADVPQGSYTLVAWHPHLGRLRVPIEVDPERPSGLIVAYSGYGILEEMYPGDTVEIEP